MVTLSFFFVGLNGEYKIRVCLFSNVGVRHIQHVPSGNSVTSRVRLSSVSSGTLDFSSGAFVCKHVHPGAANARNRVFLKGSTAMRTIVEVPLQRMVDMVTMPEDAVNAMLQLGKDDFDLSDDEAEAIGVEDAKDDIDMSGTHAI